jgi:hypothetical protein
MHVHIEQDDLPVILVITTSHIDLRAICIDSHGNSV